MGKKAGRVGKQVPAELFLEQSPFTLDLALCSSRYIAAYSTIANGSVDLCLVPEVPVVLGGAGGCLAHLERVVASKGHAVVVVAEGAGENVLGASAEVRCSCVREAGPQQHYWSVGSLCRRVRRWKEGCH